MYGDSGLKQNHTSKTAKEVATVEAEPIEEINNRLIKRENY